MNARKKQWLDTALRAQQTRTLDQRHGMHKAQSAHRQAAQSEAAAAHDLRSLTSSWRQGRDTGALPTEMEALYRRFHHQLQLKADSAAHAQRTQLQVLEQAQAELRQGHALQQALDECVKRRNQRLAKDALTRERSLAVEAWLLDKTAKKGKA